MLENGNLVWCVLSVGSYQDGMCQKDVRKGLNCHLTNYVVIDSNGGHRRKNRELLRIVFIYVSYHDNQMMDVISCQYFGSFCRVLWHNQGIGIAVVINGFINIVFIQHTAWKCCKELRL